MSNIARILPAIFLSLMGGLCQAETLGEVQARLEEEFDVRLSPQTDSIAKTDYPGVYAIRSTRANAYPAFFDDDLEVTVNFPKVEGIQRFTDEAADPQAIAARRARLAKSIPVERFIAMKGSTRPVAVILSTPECPYCRQAEAYFSEHKISYYVAPTSLTPAGLPWAVAIYCSKNPAREWREAMTKNLDGTGKPCAKFPTREVEELGYLFMKDGYRKPGKPIVIFADGSIIPGWAASQGRVVEDKIAKGMFFR